MPHACLRFWKCYKTITLCSLLSRCTIPCACHAKSHLNLQKWSGHVVFLTCWLGNVLRATTAYTFSISTFWLRNVLRATTACTFSTSQLPKVLRDHQFLTLLTLKCASRNNSVHFFDISRETQVFRDFPTFARTCIFFFLTLSLLWSSLFFSSLLFSDSSHLWFSICPYCRKFDF